MIDPVLFGTHNGGAVAALGRQPPPGGASWCSATSGACLERCDDFPIGLPSQILDVMAVRYRSEWGGGEISNFYATERIAGSRGKKTRAGLDQPQPTGPPFPSEPHL